MPDTYDGFDYNQPKSKLPTTIELWEKLDGEGCTHRMKVDSGWIYRYKAYYSNDGTICFVPDFELCKRCSLFNPNK